MMEDLDIFTDCEYSNELSVAEEEVDKLNDVTFGDEREWTLCDTLPTENEDCTFEKFQFDELGPVDDACSAPGRRKDVSDDLLGLKGSFFNFGQLKSSPRSFDEYPSIEKKNDDFEVALAKLSLLDTDLSGSDFRSVEAPLEELRNYSEILYTQFQTCQKSNCNVQYLNGVVSKHLNLLSRKLSQLGLPMDALAQLRYFRLLTNFVTVDNRINEILSRGSHDPHRFNAEIMALAKEFSQQSPQQQASLCALHPFYGMLSGYILSLQSTPMMDLFRGTIPSSGPGDGLGPRSSVIEVLHHQVSPPPLTQVSERGLVVDMDKGGWMTSSEKDWIKKVQTRNLVSDNPYLHDYYYTAFKFKEMSERRDAQLATLGQSTIPDPIFLLPSPITADQLGAGIDPTKDGLSPQYHPIQFENSLGIVTSSNLNTPRQILQVPHRQKVSVPTFGGEEDSYRMVRGQRELMGVIEKVHYTVLRVDEVDKSLAKMLVEQHHNRGVLLQHRGYLLKVIMDAVDSNTRFVQMFSVSKGARILTSVLAIITSVQFVQLIRTFFFNCLSVWESDFFGEFETDFRAIIGSRIRKLNQEELSLLITTFFCTVTSKSLHDKMKIQPLAGFCRYQFGVHVVFTLLDASFQMNPEDKSNISRLVAVILQCCESQDSAIEHLQKEFRTLYNLIL